jgi:hypothetical protein
VIRVVLALQLSVLPSAAGDLHGQEPPRVLHALPGSTLTIRGSTSVGAPWHCTASAVDARVAVSPPLESALSPLPDVRGIALQVPVGALKCQSGPMERAMRRTIRADVDTAAQTITGRFDIADDTRPPHANQRYLFGALKVAGTERNVYLTATIDPQPDGTLRVRSRIPLNLTDFGMTPPRVLFGLVRARDGVTVEVDLTYPAPRFGATP